MIIVLLYIEQDAMVQYKWFSISVITVVVQSDSYICMVNELKHAETDEDSELINESDVLHCM